MPMIDFKCTKCGNKFEELVSSARIKDVRCPKCGGRELERVYEGRWLCGTPSSSGSSCSGNCAGCSGCGKH